MASYTETKFKVSRFVSFRIGQGPIRPGILKDDAVLAFPKLAGSIEDFIKMSDDDRAATLAQVRDPIPLADVELLAPLAPRKNVFCVGRNYLAHAVEGAKARGEKLDLPDVPTFFTKAPTSIVGPETELMLMAALSEQYDWEAELGVVIGERCKNVPEEDALKVIFGYTNVNDVTARDMQRRHQQWFKGKTLDYTCPVGPWIVSADELGDPQDVTVKLRVNGVEKQNAPTSQMIFSIARIIAELSRGLTLEPGDLIATGTPEGVGMGRGEFLKHGDVMEVDISKIGVLRNKVSIQ